MEDTIDFLSKEEYESVIFTKQEIESEYKKFKMTKFLFISLNEKIDFFKRNNSFVFAINNYDILKQRKSSTLVDIDRYLHFKKIKKED